MIGTFLEQAESAFIRKQDVIAIALLGIAIDATAKAEYPGIPGTEARFDRLVTRDLGLATRIAFGNSIQTMSLAVPGNLLVAKRKLEEVPEEVYGSGADMWMLSFPKIVYRIMRSEVIHTARLPPHVQLVDDDSIQVRHNSLHLPRSMFMALLVTTILAPSNRDETAVFQTPFVWNKLQAASRLEWLFGARNDFCALIGYDANCD